jgi:hypothetical protein
MPARGRRGSDVKVRVPGRKRQQGSDAEAWQASAGERQRSDVRVRVPALKRRHGSVAEAWQASAGEPRLALVAKPRLPQVGLRWLVLARQRRAVEAQLRGTWMAVVPRQKSVMIVGAGNIVRRPCCEPRQRNRMWLQSTWSPI